MKIENKKKKSFSPLIFLGSLGAGGLSVAFFSFMNYTIQHGEGLIKFSQTHEILSGYQEFLYSFFELGMFLFAIIHIVLSVAYLPEFIKWLKGENYKEFIKNPLVNAGILAPFISITMTMNVFLAVVRYFIPIMSDNLQFLMLPGLLGWIILWVLLMKMEIKLLKISFTEGFDVNKISFGWLLHPFALGMLTVTGSGIAAMSQNSAIAHTAFFMLLVSGTMGLFLLMIKIIAIFKSHFALNGLPDKEFLPSFLIVIPNITLFAITFFRIGHYLHNHFDTNLGVYYMLVVTVAFAFETWYMIFGLSLLSNYFKNNFQNEYYVSQWGLVCPFVAYAVLGAFVYMLFWQNPIMLLFLVGIILLTVVLFFVLLKKQFLDSKT